MSDKEDENFDFKGEVVDSKRISEVSEVGNDNYKLYNEPKPINYDINKIDPKIIKSEMELRSITNQVSSDYSSYNSLNQEEKLDDDNKLDIPIITHEKEEQNNLEDKSALLFGNDINNLYPKYLGKMLSFIYIKNEPLITIGPDCKFFQII
jgi:hypothetical protein